MAQSAKIIRELAINFIARMKEQNLHYKYQASPIYKTEINTRAVEFFTGAYVALRTFGRDDDAREVGVFTATSLAPLGYACLGRVVDGKDPTPTNVLVTLDPRQ